MSKDERESRQASFYIITMCTDQKRQLLGDIADGQMHLSTCGLIAQSVWNSLPTRFSWVELDRFVVMPNHVHGIINITRSYPILYSKPHGFMVTGADADDPQGTIRVMVSAMIQYPILGEIMRTFKGMTSYQIHKAGIASFAWQGQFFASIIRDEVKLERARRYIVSNPTRWSTDKYYVRN